MTELHTFAPYLQRWQAQPDGQPWATPRSDLLAVTLSGAQAEWPAVLKIPRAGCDAVGAQLLQGWGGVGAARVYACDALTGAVLMERATGPRQLRRMALHGEDDAAARSICECLAQLHAHAPVPSVQLPPLRAFFASLWAMAPRAGGLLAVCAEVAAALLQAPQDVVVLHADAHHGNILDFGARGWLAIDPKGAVGERTYDYVQVLCNPELPTGTKPARFARQLDVLVQAADLERQRLLRWVMAHAGLSAAWFLEDGLPQQAHRQLAIARLAQQVLGAA